MVEASRMADRLEELNSVIQGKGVLDLMRFRLHEHWGEEGDRTVRVEVKFDSVLGEARQLQLAFDRLCSTLKVSAAAVSTVKVTTSDDLRARRAARISKATGS